MKKILAFSGSNSSTSINEKLVDYTVSLLPKQAVKRIKLTEFPLPIFSEDLEKQEPYPIHLIQLKNEIKEADALLISVNEHNGAVSAFFKNYIDWLSRIEYKFLAGKKILLMSTSPGKRGGASALDYVKNVLPRFDGEIIESFSFPSFSENFSVEQNIVTNEVLRLGLHDVIQNFAHQIDV
ncbi:NADPH-dependent FMN reductase [Jejudonia soesokkakensis]|uniref:NADPH-dependent FMN reductase n=1 Tax=Jejudonia soesokkakensis TaxID=1323432 RepID=A0ABW2MUB1_9FLAO